MANYSVLVAILLGIELILASPIYETSSEIAEPAMITTTEETDLSTEIPSEKSEDLKSAETGLGFIGIGIPIYGGYGGYGGGWGGGWGHGGWGHHHHHHHGHWGGHHGHWGGHHGHGHWRG